MPFREWATERFSGQLVEFLSDLKRLSGPGALRRTVSQLLRNDGLALAGQLAYFFILFLFPFLIFLVTLVGVVVDEPESTLKSLATSMEGFLPQQTIDLLRDYLTRTLQSTSSPTVILSIMITLGAGSAATEAIISASNRFYGVSETRSFWKVRGIAVVLILGFTLMIATMAVFVLSPDAEAFLRRLPGVPDAFVHLWDILRWVLVFLNLTLALDILYYVAPNADIPFRWITPGGFMATILLIVANQIMIFWVANVFRYNQLYGQLGAGIVLLIWLYVTGLTVLAGIQANAVLARMAEERKGVELVQSKPSERDDD
jgi:membrane protein